MENTITMNGKEIATLAELRNNFDIGEAIVLQKSGKLSEWLGTLYYENEAKENASAAYSVLTMQLV